MEGTTVLPFDETGTIFDVDMLEERGRCMVKFGLTVGAVIVSCYYRGVLDPRPCQGQRAHVVGQWLRLTGCGSVAVDSVGQA